MNDGDKDIPMQKDITVAGFIRIPKTGSTTMARFLHIAPVLHSWLDFLSEVPLDNEGNPDRHVLKGISCVFGYAPTTAHLGKNHEIDFFKSNDWFNCPHVPYNEMMRKWSTSLETWSPPETAVLADNIKTSESVNFHFKAFTIVRDPFDRLLSLFYYMAKQHKRAAEGIKVGFLTQITDAQYDRVVANDIEGWMELLHSECAESGSCALLNSQYQYVDKDLDVAIDLISVSESVEGNKVEPAKVFAIVNECYDVSLRLLSEAVDGIRSDDVTRFLETNHFHANENKESYSTLTTETKSNLRAKAEEWFKEEFHFYDAVVEQYKKYLDSSKIDKSLFEGCALWNQAHPQQDVLMG
jgi:hypothetical protein